MKVFQSVMAATAVAMLVVTLASPAQAKGHNEVQCQPDNSGRVICGSSVAVQPSHTERKAHRRTRAKAIAVDANGSAAASGIVVSKKTGATARVGAQYAAAFQAYVDDLENGGAAVHFMGGIRRGSCSNRHMHPCGRALDVCQLSRGRVDRRCNLPGPAVAAAMAEKHGLFEGGRWCHSDYGHVQAGVSAAACGERSLAARRRHLKVPRK